jgi:hypothetical protein
VSLDEGERAFIDSLERRIHNLEELVDTYLDSPVWKRVWFWGMGWPTDRIVARPAYRWWRRSQ